MKRFKKTINIILVVILAIGLGDSIRSYAEHEINCHGCSSHSIHPYFELIYFGIIVLFVTVIFSISRLIMWLVDNKKNSQSNSELQVIKAKKIIYILTLLILGGGFIHVMILFIKSTVEYIIYLGELLMGNAALNFVLLFPYVLIALLIFGLGKMIILVIEKREKRRTNEKV